MFNAVDMTDQFADNQRVGPRLAAQRKALGLSVDDVATRCGVKADYLRAIEKSDLSILPTHGYAIGYVRAYARTLGLPVVKTVEAFKAEIGGAVQAPQRRFWHGSTIGKSNILGRLPRGSVPALGVIAFVTMIGTWYGVQLETVAAPGPSAPVALDADRIEDSAPIPDDMITLEATAPSWISIRDPRGRMIVNRVFVTGENWQARMGQAYSVTVRDGAAVTLYLGETRLGTMGIAGEPVTDFDLRQINTPG